MSEAVRTRYRPEIDGLRAIAVVAVVFYHAELRAGRWQVLPGGFLGVDVFFVISGFLMAAILHGARPGLWRFYRGRLIRLWPSLVLVLLLCCGAAYSLLVPVELVKFARELTGALGFHANYVFAQEDSYVAAASKFKPLIHTWSLGVEWQFYMLFPLLLLPLARARPQRALAVIAVASLGSFAYCLYLMRSDQAQAFYSSVARSWELLCGSGVYFWSLRVREGRSREWLAWLGLGIIAWALVAVDHHDRHPGWINLAVATGTGLVILHSHRGGWSHQLLSSRGMVWIGLLSFPLYLYHQPMFAFYRVAVGEIAWGSFIGLVVAAVVLAYATLVFYERPIRYATRAFTQGYVLAGAMLVLAFAIGARLSDGYPERLSEEARRSVVNYDQVEFRRLKSNVPGKKFGSDEPTALCIDRMPTSACQFGRTARVVNVGDSYAGVFDMALKEAYSDDGLLLQTYEQCPLLDQPIWFGDKPECWEVNKARWQVIGRLAPAKVVVGTNYRQFYQAKRSKDPYRWGEVNADESVDPEVVFASFRSSVRKLVALGHTPVVLTQPPTPVMEVGLEVRRRMITGQWTYQDEFGAVPNQALDDRVRALLADTPGVRVLDLSKTLCNAQGECLQIDAVDGLYNGGEHLSFHGASLVLPSI